MNFRLLFRLFIAQVFFLMLITLCILGGLIWGKMITIAQILNHQCFNIPCWQIYIAVLLAISFMYATYLMIEVSKPYEHIRAKINWLLLGKYQNKLFNISETGAEWYDQHYTVSSDLNQIRDKMFQFSKDLQEFSAAPVFVGEDTKEEIIEKERHRIARELHDSVSQQLFAATMMVSTISEEIDENTPKTLVKQIEIVNNVIGNAQTEMRALLLHLRPIELADKSLKLGIEQLLMELKTKVPMEVIWTLEETKQENGIEDHLFRICQEAISNTLRHANASKLEVYLSQNSDAVHLKIMDDGTGFNHEEIHQNGSYGLMNIQERVKNMGGECKIISKINQGTIIDITIPNSSHIK